LWSIITKSIKKSIKDKFNWKLDNFTNELWRVYELRNKIWHNSQNYFINDKEITFDLTKIEDLIENLQSNFIELSKCFFNEMNTLLNIRI
jgi:hypothetical protein